MAPRTDVFDLARLRLSAGEGRRLLLGVALGEFASGNERYETDPPLVPVTLDRFRVDPAVSSAVFVTTITDVTGFFSFLGLAALVGLGR